MKALLESARRFPRSHGLVLLALLVLGRAQSASASTLLYAAMRGEPYGWQGDCRLCHQDALGTAGSATQPFAKTLESKGISATSTGAELLDALAGYSDEDSDEDGIADVEELLTGTDPNVAIAGARLETVDYRYGCLNVSSGPAGLATSLGDWALLTFGIVLLATRRAARRA